MRKLRFVMAIIGGLMAGGSAFAAPAAPEFDVPYQATFSACTIPSGSAEACRAAIEALIDAYIGPDPVVPIVSEADSLTSFTALRGEVIAANEPDPAFQAVIEAIFEELLPDSGALPDLPSPT